LPPPVTIFAEIGQRLQLVGVGNVLAHRDRPGVVGRRRRQPDDLVGVVIELLDRFIGLLRVLPGRIVALFEEEGAVAGIFRIDVDLAGGDRLAHDRCRSELDTIGGLDVVRLQHGKDDIAQHAAFGIDLGRDDDLGFGSRGGECKRNGGTDQCPGEVQSHDCLPRF
jgi:hypothetical protein